MFNRTDCGSVRINETAESYLSAVFFYVSLFRVTPAPGGETRYARQRVHGVGGEPEGLDTRGDNRGHLSRPNPHGEEQVRNLLHVLQETSMRNFDSLSEQEILALAISLEEEDARIYHDFADGLKDSYPAQAAKFNELRAEEDGHRHRLLDLHKRRFGDHVPLIRRQDVKGFVSRKPVWLVRPLGLSAARKQAALMEIETRRFYEAAARRTTDAAIRQLLGDLAEEERKHTQTAAELGSADLTEDDDAARKRLFA